MQLSIIHSVDYFKIHVEYRQEKMKSEKKYNILQKKREEDNAAH